MNSDRTKLSLILFFTSLFLVSCQSQQKTPTSYEKAETLHQKIYQPMLEESTREMSGYDGLHNEFSLKSTLLTPELLKKQTELQSLYWQWSPKKTNKEFRDIENQNKTKIFMSFFTPISEAQDLSSKKSPWKVVLEVNGQKYEGMVKEHRGNMKDIEKLYPYHNRWSRAFTATFLLPAKTAAKSQSKLTLTSAISARSVTFNSTK